MSLLFLPNSNNAFFDKASLHLIKLFDGPYFRVGIASGSFFYSSGRKPFYCWLPLVSSFFSALSWLAPCCACYFRSTIL